MTELTEGEEAVGDMAESGSAPPSGEPERVDSPSASSGSGAASSAVEPASSRARDVESSRAAPELPGVTAARAAQTLKEIANAAPDYEDIARRFKPEGKKKRR